MRSGLAILVLVGAGALAGCGEASHETPAQAAPIPVSVVVPGPEAAPAGPEVTGTVQPLRRATPGTILMGRVEAVPVTEGDRVRRGQLLARIDSRDAAARVAQAEAQVAAAAAMEDNARRMRERMERLEARQAASRKNVEDALAGHEAAMAALAAAREGLGAARAALGYASVTAPFDGVVTAKRVEAGDTAAPGMPLFTVEDLSRVKVEASVAESALAALRPGAAVELVLDAVPGGPRAATVDEVLPSADPLTRTGTVRVLLDNPDGAIRSGMFARVRLPGGPGEPAPRTVPASALVRRGPLTGVYVVDAGGVARLRYVSAGREAGGKVAILAGLGEGERVVAEVPSGLEDGRRVEVR